MSGSETRMAKLRLSQGETTIVSKQEICEVVVARALLVAFALAQEGPELAPAETTSGATQSHSQCDSSDCVRFSAFSVC